MKSYITATFISEGYGGRLLPNGIKKGKQRLVLSDGTILDGERVVFLEWLTRRGYGDNPFGHMIDRDDGATVYKIYYDEREPDI
jgi:hypothetical protein